AAMADARATIQAYPPSTFGRLCLLTAFSLAKSSPDSIIRVANEILANDPNSMIALSNVAEAYKAKGDRDKFIEYSLRIYHADKSNATIGPAIINELAQAGSPDKALPIVDDLLKDNPGDPQMLRTKWLLQLGAHRYKDAYVTAEELAKADTSILTPEFFTRMAGAAQLDSNPAKQAEYLARGVQRFPKNADMQLAYAQTLYKA